MKNLILILWFVLFLSPSTLAGVEYVTEQVCHAMTGCWLDTKTGECPDCVIERREVVHTHEETPVIVEKPFVKLKRTFTTLVSPEVYGVSTFWEPKKTVKKTVKVEIPKKKKTIKKKGNWTCIVGPCDFIDEDGNLIEKG